MKGNTEDKSNTATLDPGPRQSVPVTPVAPAKKAAAGPLHQNWDEDEPVGFAKHRMKVIVGVLSLGALIAAKTILSSATNAPAPKEETQTVRIVMPPTAPPPPPPPPPPPQEVVKEEKIIEEEKVEEAEPDPTPQVETALKGAGTGGMVLKSGNGSGVFTPRNTVNSEKARWSAYANQAGSRLKDLLRSHPKTKKYKGVFEARVWPDSTGRVTRAVLTKSSGDSETDAAIVNEVFTGAQLPSPPPDASREFIIMRFTGKSPN